MVADETPVKRPRRAAEPAVELDEDLTFAALFGSDEEVDEQAEDVEEEADGEGDEEAAVGSDSVTCDICRGTSEEPVCFSVILFVVVHPSLLIEDSSFAVKVGGGFVFVCLLARSLACLFACLLFLLA